MARKPIPAQKTIMHNKRPSEDDRVELEETKITPLAPLSAQEQSKSLVLSQRRSALESQMAYAFHNPRNPNRAMEKMHSYARNLSEEAAAKMTYHVPRGGKMINGPSIRFAELMKLAWGHSKSTAHVTEVNREAMYVEAEGIYLDLETNTESSSVVRRPIRDKYGQCYNEATIDVTCNAACAIAKRNAILEGIPRPLWENAYEASKSKAAGNIEGLPKKREETLRHFLREGVAPDRVLATLGLRSESQIKLEHISTLRGMWGSLQSGEATIDELFPPIKEMVGVDQEQADPPKQRKTLADLAEDGEVEVMTQSSEERQEAIKQACDAGMQAYHKGISLPPKDIRSDPILAGAWHDGYAAAAGQERADDDEDTAGAKQEA